TAAHHGLVVKRVTETKARCDVVVIFDGRGRVETHSSECGARVLHSWFGEILKVVTKTEVERQLRRDAPVVLYEESVFVQIGIRRSACRSCAGKVLDESCGCIRGKERVGVERELTGEKSGEEVEHAIEVQVGAELQAVFAVRETDHVDELRALNGRLARAEVVAAQLEKAAASLNACFGDVAVRFAGFAVAAELKAKVINQFGRES